VPNKTKERESFMQTVNLIKEEAVKEKTAMPERAEIPKKDGKAGASGPDTQDRVAAAQIYLSLAALAAILAVKFLFPGLMSLLDGQYREFVTPPPVWDLEGIKRIIGAAAFTGFLL
jgi:hypothetical protein